MSKKSIIVLMCHHHKRLDPEMFSFIAIYCHVLVTRYGVWIDNCIYGTLITLNYK
jgi:hypothetical protein